MQTISLGNTDLRVSSVCLGCMGLGNPTTGQHRWTVKEDVARSIVKAALDNGINFFDTAPVYQQGTSERYLGRALKAFARREDVVIATKFLPRSDEEIASGVSPQAHIEASVTASLERLETDCVDLLVYHMWDFRSSLIDILQGLDAVVRAGKVRHVGISNCFLPQLAEAQTLAEREDLTPFVSVQNHYNLIFREEERETAPYCRENNLLMTPYSPLASGRLSRRPGESTRRLREDDYARLKYDGTQEADRRIIDRVAEIAERRGVSMTEVSLAWLQHQGAVPIAGATSPQQIEDLARSASLCLTPEETAYLEAPYVPHAPVGVMAQNTAEAAGKKDQAWFSSTR